MGGCCIFLFKSFGSGPLCNWVICLLDNLSFLQCFCAFSGCDPSGYRFLIIQCVDCYVFKFFTVWNVSLSAPLEVVAGLFSQSPLEVGTWYLSGFACFSMRGAFDVLF